ncbi:hypothetical protein N9T73_00215, partial [bacterium]|nr:hypothetical protein [bacterium]
SGNDSGNEPGNESGSESGNESEQEKTKSNTINDNCDFTNTNYITAIKCFILTKHENIENLDETDFMN